MFSALTSRDLSPAHNKIRHENPLFFGLWGSCTASEPTKPFPGISIKLGVWMPGKWIFDLADEEL